MVTPTNTSEAFGNHANSAPRSPTLALIILVLLPQMGREHLGKHRVHVRPLRRLRISGHAHVRYQPLPGGRDVPGLPWSDGGHDKGGVRHDRGRFGLLRRQRHRRASGLLSASLSAVVFSRFVGTCLD